MYNYDDIFETQDSQASPEFDRDAWAAKKQADRNQLYALADSIAESIVQDSDKFRDYLDVQARFGSYSVTNALLILAQKPQATQIKSFEDWQKADVNIKRYQKGFTILEPGQEYTRSDGSPAVSYEPKKVFDISQTTARPRAKNEAQRDEKALVTALLHKPPVPIRTVDELPNGVGAYYDHKQGIIFARKGMSLPSIFCNVSMELVRAELAADDPNYDRRATSFTAYCASYILCKKNGFDVSGYNFTELPDHIRNADPKTIRGELTKIRDTTSTISMRMYRAMNQDRQPKPRQQER